MRPKTSPEGTDEGWISEEIRRMASAWNRGEQVTARELIARHPGLRNDAALRLIYEEICLRRDAGEAVVTSEVVAGFPHVADDLRALLDCDRMIREGETEVTFPEVGECLGPFQLLAELGRGASGRTYLASDPTLADRPVVVKVIPDDQDEHLALARLRHTHIVPLFCEHTFQERGLRGLCMPFLGGASMAEILEDLDEFPLAKRNGALVVKRIDERTPLTSAATPGDGPFRRSLEGASFLEAMTWIVSCLADALHYAHARGLVHMDIKPSNVLITTDGQPMLLDFHLARGPIAAGEWVLDRLGGTPGWMSPEQQLALDSVRDGQPAQVGVDGRTDIYALGLLLAQALGAPGPDVHRGPLRIPGISIGLNDIVRKCLALNPDDRYPDAAALAEDLRRELNDLPLRGVRNRSVFELSRKWRRRHPGLLAWSAAACLALAAAGLAGSASWIAYNQRVGRATAYLEDARRSLAAGRFAESLASIDLGLSATRRLPGMKGVRTALERERAIARRASVAEDLHKLADRVRFRYGVELPSRTDAESLIHLCETLWGRRNLLLSAQSGPDDSAIAKRIRVDLLELVTIWSDLLVWQSGADSVDHARAEALQLLDNAESECGESLAIDARRRGLRGETSGRDLVETYRDSSSSWEHYELGRFELRNGRIESAAEEFRLALESHPEDLWSNFYLGLCAYRLGRFHEAVASFQACIALQPAAAIAHYNRALAYEALDDLENARRGYSRAIELDPKLAPARLNRGILSYKSGDTDAAIRDFLDGIQASYGSALRGRLYYNLALARLAAHDRPSALRDAQRASQLGCTEANALLDRLRARASRE